MGALAYGGKGDQTSNTHSLIMRCGMPSRKLPKKASKCGALSGHRCSSTRAELAAGIVAASAEKAQHQGTDSKAYLDKMQKLIDGANLTNKRPWSIQANGDLWQWMEDILKAKGRSSFKITKVKGHVTEQQVLEGK